jgi:DNA-directed RNA polymerase specialized sigma24 family protein
MITEPREFEELLGRLRRGEAEAFWEILERYDSYMRSVVHHSLNPKLRTKFDSIDFTQAAWASFFRQREEIKAFVNPRQLLEFLKQIARHKVATEHRRFFSTAKHDVNREMPFDDAAHGGATVPNLLWTASQVAIARERWEATIAGKPAQYRLILELRLSGMTYEEIASELGIHKRTVIRVMNRLLEEFQNDGEH